MSSSFALWLVGILTVVTGLVIWRILAGGRTTADPAPIVEGDPATAADDQERPTVANEVPAPAAVTGEPAPAEQDAAAPPAAEPVAAPEEAAPVSVPAPRASSDDVTVAEVEPAATAVAGAVADEPADDFRQIQGIGPKMAAALQAAGIRTYQQLAELDEAALREAIKAAGLRAAPSVATWPQQAKVLAAARAEAGAALS